MSYSDIELPELGEATAPYLTPQPPLRLGEGEQALQKLPNASPLSKLERGFRGEVRFGIVISLMLLLVAMSLPPTHAAPPSQFAGCVDEDDEAFAARYVLHDVFDTIFTVTVIGLDDFDPQLMIRYDDTYICNQDADNGIYFGADLPTAQTGFRDNTAQLEVRFLEEEFPDAPPSDFEILVTGKNGESGEFLLMVWGASIFGADDVDEVSFSVTEEQIAQEMPFIFYTANFNPDEFRLSPEISLILGTDFAITCSVSSLADLCDGETIPLDGFTVTTDYLQELELNGNDVMLNFSPNLAGEDYVIEIRSQDSLTFGPYIFMAQAGVAYPE